MRAAAVLLTLLALASGAALAHGARIDERAYAAAGLASSCAPGIALPHPANANDICFTLQRDETSWHLHILDARPDPVGARVTTITTTNAGTTMHAQPACGDATGEIAWTPNTVRIVLNVDLGSPSACGLATAGVLRLEAYDAD